MSAALLAAAIGVLAGCGAWLCLRARSFDVVLGLTLLSYAVNLFIAAMGRIGGARPPIVEPGAPASLAHYADPLPQALVLTAIVIGFAMTALTLALAVLARHRGGDDAVDDGLGGPDGDADAGAGGRERER